MYDWRSDVKMIVRAEETAGKKADWRIAWCWMSDGPVY